MKKAYVIMTRIPIPGQTKTRLMPHLTPEECARLHLCFLEDLWETTKALQDTIDIYLAYSDEGDHSVLLPSLPSFVSIFPQVGQSLGEKMNHVIEHLLQKGYEKVILTGCDIPNINSDIIKEGFYQLEHNDIVIAPTTDGGYYLIGCKDSIEGIFLPTISWGEGSVFSQTTRLIQSLNKTCYTLPELSDIDTIEDIVEFKHMYKHTMNQKDIPEHTLSFIHTLNL